MLHNKKVLHGFRQERRELRVLSWSQLLSHHVLSIEIIPGKKAYFWSLFLTSLCATPVHLLEFTCPLWFVGSSGKFVGESPDHHQVLAELFFSTNLMKAPLILSQ